MKLWLDVEIVSAILSSNIIYKKEKLDYNTI